MELGQPKRVKDSALGARSFYLFMAGFTFMILGMYDNEFREAVINFKIIYVGTFFILVGVSYRLFVTCGSNPGFLNRNEKGILELQSKQTDDTEKEMVISIPTETTTSLIDSEENPEQIKKIEQPINTVALEVNNDNGFPAKRFCEKCQIYQEYRSKHCHLCGRCVRKFDHHCFWVGGCIGELNHGKFTAFLVLQTIVQIWLVNICFEATGRYPDTKAKEYGAFCVLGFVHVLFTFFVGILAGFHVFLITSGQTTWEFMRKGSIEYLKIYPRGFYPFDHGIRNNLRQVFFHNNTPREWTLPPVATAMQNRVFNWCENEYYSCC